MHSTTKNRMREILILLQIASIFAFTPYLRTKTIQNGSRHLIFQPHSSSCSTHFYTLHHHRHHHHFNPFNHFSRSNENLQNHEFGSIATSLCSIQDNKTNDDIQINSNSFQSSSFIGTQPTVIITPNETSEEIYASALQRTFLWVLSAGVFGLGLFFGVGRDISEQFFAGYLLEQSLSVDNLLVFLLLFDYFKVPLSSQDRVLNYGIYGAIVMRAVMIGLGAVALKQFHAVLLVFAGVLIYSSASVLLGGDEDMDGEEEDMSENKIVQFSRNLIDSTDTFDGDRFFTTVEGGIKKATPLLICMIAVEVSDVVFAVDSIPAVFGVTEVSF